MHLPVLTYNIHAAASGSTASWTSTASLPSSPAVAPSSSPSRRSTGTAASSAPSPTSRRHLADRLGMRLAYAACLDDEPVQPGAGRAQYGTALLSTRPLVDVSTTLLPCFPGSEQRGLLEASVELGGASLRVLGTHLQWDREDERLAQARAVTATLDDRPTLLLGDLNTTPGSATYEHLGTRLDDSWARVGDGEGHTFDVELPPRRIDYVWVGGGVRALGARVLPSPASDHAALLVDVEVPATGLGHPKSVPSGVASARWRTLDPDQQHRTEGRHHVSLCSTASAERALPPWRTISAWLRRGGHSRRARRRVRRHSPRRLRRPARAPRSASAAAGAPARRREHLGPRVVVHDRTGADPSTAAFADATTEGPCRTS